MRKNPGKTLRSCITCFFLVGFGQLMGCSTQQAYGAGQAWQRSECNKISDAQERNQCMTRTDTSYEAYKRQEKAAKGAN
ncbi:hypothetical protein EGT07_10105 [Herbaspirillum sp. HC18]|nr:hypothetical protein EGT07_10105 [Herbaspirillum sp. HC18]